MNNQYEHGSGDGGGGGEPFPRTKKRRRGHSRQLSRKSRKKQKTECDPLRDGEGLMRQLRRMQRDEQQTSAQRDAMAVGLFNTTIGAVYGSGQQLTYAQNLQRTYLQQQIAGLLSHNAPLRLVASHGSSPFRHDLEHNAPRPSPTRPQPDAVQQRNALPQPAHNPFPQPDAVQQQDAPPQPVHNPFPQPDAVQQLDAQPDSVQQPDAMQQPDAVQQQPNAVQQPNVEQQQPNAFPQPDDVQQQPNVEQQQPRVVQQPNVGNAAPYDEQFEDAIQDLSDLSASNGMVNQPRDSVSNGLESNGTVNHPRTVNHQRDSVPDGTVNRQRDLGSDGLASNGTSQELVPYQAPERSNSPAELFSPNRASRQSGLSTPLRQDLRTALFSHNVTSISKDTMEEIILRARQLGPLTPATIQSATTVVVSSQTLAMKQAEIENSNHIAGLTLASKQHQEIIDQQSEHHFENFKYKESEKTEKFVTRCATALIGFGLLYCFLAVAAGGSYNLSQFKEHPCSHLDFLELSGGPESNSYDFGYGFGWVSFGRFVEWLVGCSCWISAGIVLLGAVGIFMVFHQLPKTVKFVLCFGLYAFALYQTLADTVSQVVLVTLFVIMFLPALVFSLSYLFLYEKLDKARSLVEMQRARQKFTFTVKMLVILQIFFAACACLLLRMLV